jgi:hypothetical protein
MSDSIEWVLEQRANKDAAIRRALAVYPDLVFDGPYLSSRSLKHEDCDIIVCVEGHKGATALRPGRDFGEVVVLREWMSTTETQSFIHDVKIRDPDLYARILAALVKR